MNRQETTSKKSLKAALLAGTCLTTGAPLANAALYIETIPEFSNALAGALLAPVPIGTDQVTGNVAFTTDPSDFIAFTGLAAGSSFSLSFVNGSNNFNIDVQDSSGSHLGTPSALTGVSGTNTFTGTVPTDGKLVAVVGYNEGNPYTINLTATLVPETNSAALAGLGVAAAVLRRSRRTKKDA